MTQKQALELWEMYALELCSVDNTPVMGYLENSGEFCCVLNTGKQRKDTEYINRMYKEGIEYMKGPNVHVLKTTDYKYAIDLLPFIKAHI